MSMTPRTDSDALLPCPFCGSTDLIEDRLARVCCENCGATAPYGYKVSESWNTRAESPDLIALRKERDAAIKRGDNHWETLRSIRHMASQPEPDFERIVLWVNDAGSGCHETVAQTMAALSDEKSAARDEAEALRKERDALREALDEITHMGHDAPMTWAGSDLDWANRRAGLMQSIARAALATEGQS